MKVIGSLKLLNKRIENINNMQDDKVRGEECKKLFADVLNQNDLYIVKSNKEATEKNDDRIRPFVGLGPSGFTKSYFLRVFTDEALANKFAEREEVLSEEPVVKISASELVHLVKDYFVMGVDGVLLNDGADWITLNCDAVLYIAFTDVLNIPEAFNSDFVNMVNAIYDIIKSRVRIVTPYKKFEGIHKDDVLNGKAELFSLDSELLMIEYYDKYKVEKIFNDNVYWLDMDIDTFCYVVKEALENGIASINIVYRNKQGSGSPKEILSLLETIGYKR